MFAWMAAKWALSAPFRREAGRAVQSIPREVWYALAVAMALFFVRIWFNGQIEAAEKRGSDAAYASVEAKARKIKERADQITSGTSTLLRNLNDEEIAASALAMMLCACPGPVRQSVPVLPDFPAPPVNTSRPVGEPLQPWIACLIQNGPSSSQCRSTISLSGPKLATSTAPKS